jgi:hypothetical protein
MLNSFLDKNELYHGQLFKIIFQHKIVNKFFTFLTLTGQIRIYNWIFKTGLYISVSFFSRVMLTK